jgi:hypothetical protein
MRAKVGAHRSFSEGGLRLTFGHRSHLIFGFGILDLPYGAYSVAVTRQLVELFSPVRIRLGTPQRHLAVARRLCLWFRAQYVAPLQNYFCNTIFALFLPVPQSICTVWGSVLDDSVTTAKPAPLKV